MTRYEQGESVWKKRSSEFIHDRAIKWGFKEMSGRPLVSIHCHPYIDQPIPLCDEINYLKNAHIGIFELNGLWGCEVGIRMPSGQGKGYKSFLGFCNPFPTRQGAIDDAVSEILAYIHRNVPMTEDDQRCVRQLDKWCEKLVLPQQLRMKI